MIYFFRTLILSIITICTLSVSADVADVRFVAIVDGESQSTDVILDGLRSRGAIIDTIEASVLDSEAFREKKLKSTDKILVVGRNALSEYMEHQVENKVIVVMVRESVFHHLMEAYSKISMVTGKSHYPENIGIIYQEASVQSQFELIKNVGQINEVTVFVSKLTRFKTDEIVNTGQRLGIDVEVIDVDEGENMTKALNSISKESALLLLPDWYIFNQRTAKNIYITSFRAKIPVFGYSKGTVSAGSIASYHVDTSDLVDDIVDMSKTGVKKMFSKRLTMSVNESVARSLNKLRFLSVVTGDLEVEHDIIT